MAVDNYSRTQNVEPRTLFTDTHCHIHDPEFFPDGGKKEYEQALAVGVHQVVCVGTDLKSSQAAVDFASKHDHAFAAVGIHPHDALREGEWFEEIQNLVTEALQISKNQDLRTVVAVGEIGLDYHYMHSPRQVQIELFEKQLEMSIKFGLPVSFHVREAFADFWAVVDNFTGVRGVLHSFTDSLETMEKGLERGLFIGVNGIVTFASGVSEVAEAVPLERILLETDSPYLTPSPLRGKINVPGNVSLVASYVAALRGITVEELSQRTEQNVSRLFF